MHKRLISESNGRLCLINQIDRVSVIKHLLRLLSRCEITEVGRQIMEAGTHMSFLILEVRQKRPQGSQGQKNGSEGKEKELGK